MFKFDINQKVVIIKPDHNYNMIGTVKKRQYVEDENFTIEISYSIQISEHSYYFYLERNLDYVNKGEIMAINPKGILIQIDTDPQKEDHICFQVRKEGYNLILIEIVDRYYEHPDSDGMMLIPRIEIKRHPKNNNPEYQAALELLNYAQKNIKNIL
jgi:hypothetical protein